MADPASRRATWADLEALPRDVVGELIRGVLHSMPRPRARHQHAGTQLVGELHEPYRRGRNGPGGWLFLAEPGLAFADLDVEEVVPDVAGWRRERLSALPTDGSISVAPDWVCEILSPSTRRHDQRVKRPLYAEARIPWMWIVDVDARTVMASRNEGGRWMEIGVWADDERMRAEPFEAHEFDLRELWEASSP